MTRHGTFYGIGVGPGDPELITLKAKKVLERVRFVFSPISGKGKKSIAFGIAKAFISPDASVEFLVFPMTTSKTVCERAWEENVRRIVAVIEKGNDAAFITIGDPMTYSTYGYLLKKMKTMFPMVRPVTVPGVPSYLAGAASANLPLAEGKEVMTLIPGHRPVEHINKLLSLSDTAIFLKHHKKTEDLYKILQDKHLLDKTIYVRRCGLEDQIVISNPTPDVLKKTDYLSLLVVKK